MAKENKKEKYPREGVPREGISAPATADAEIRIAKSNSVCAYLITASPFCQSIFIFIFLGLS